MASWTLDASAVLAALRNEPGGDAAIAAFSTSIISAVNLCEVVTRLIDGGSSDEEAELLARSPRYDIIDFDEGLSLRSGALRRSIRHRGLSLGDRACLALAEREGLPVLTADRSWAELDIGVQIRLIR